jgi:hypothetical protein
VIFAFPGTFAAKLTALADKGDSLAEYQLGLHFRDGAWMVKRDPVQSRL